MKILLTMVLAMGLCISSINAQELEIATEETLTELSQERATKHGRNGRTWLRGLDLTTEQWGLIKIERQKFGASMKLARDGMREQLNIILTPEQQEALKAKREGRRNNRALRGLWRNVNGNGKGHRRGHRPNLPEEWKIWDDEAKKAWKDERKAEWKERREARKEHKAEEEAAE